MDTQLSTIYIAVISYSFCLIIQLINEYIFLTVPVLGCFGCFKKRTTVTARVNDIVLDRTRTTPIGMILHDTYFWKFHFDPQRLNQPRQPQPPPRPAHQTLPRPRQLSRSLSRSNSLNF